MALAAEEPGLKWQKAAEPPPRFFFFRLSRKFNSSRSLETAFVAQCLPRGAGSFPGGSVAGTAAAGRVSAGAAALSAVPVPGTGRGVPPGEVTVVPSRGHLGLCRRQSGFVLLLSSLFLQELFLSWFLLCNKGD